MKYILILALLASGCAEIGLYNSKEDCRGQSRERNMPNGYPCACCKPDF
jgi:hypothetical protein